MTNASIEKLIKTRALPIYTEAGIGIGKALREAFTPKDGERWMKKWEDVLTRLD